MNKKRLAIGLGFCFTALFLITLVTLTINISTHKISIFAGSACDFPCWNNVKLGQTSKAELLRILAAVPPVDQASIFSQHQLSNFGFDEVVSFATDRNWMGSYQYTGDAWLLDNKVLELSFIGNTGKTLSQTIQILGAPDFVYVFPETERTAVGVRVFFKNKGVNVGFTLNSIDSDLAPDQNINFLDLVDPNSYQKMLESGEFTEGPLGLYQPVAWSGYGKIKDYWSPRNSH